MKKSGWDKFASKIDGMSLRERMLTFAAVSAVIIALTKSVLIDPLLLQQKNLSKQLLKQEGGLKEAQAQIEVLQHTGKAEEESPLRARLDQVQQQLAEGAAYLQHKRERLVAPDQMPELLEQMLERNGRLQLLSLHNLPATPVLEKPINATAQNEKQLFKHGVQITVRGNYLDMLQYLTELERLPAQMFWGEAALKVETHPDAVLTLTLYTLSQDKTWLQI